MVRDATKPWLCFGDGVHRGGPRASQPVADCSPGDRSSLFFHHLGEGTQRYARITLIFRNGDFREYQAGDAGRAVIGNEEPYQVRGNVLRLTGSADEPGCVASFRYVIR